MGSIQRCLPIANNGGSGPIRCAVAELPALIPFGSRPAEQPNKCRYLAVLSDNNQLNDMINYLLGAFLVATVTLAQTPQQPATRSNATKPKSGDVTASKSTSATSSKSGSASGAKSATAPKTAAAAQPMHPLPQPSLKTKLQSNDNANPNYRKEKEYRGGFKREYTPRRTASGARPDTMNQLKH